MKRTILILATTLQIILMNAQEKYNNQYGKVSQYEMDMTEYEEDKDAEAVMIYEIGENRFIVEEGKGFMMQMSKTSKIKILKQAGVDYATIEIPYYRESSRYMEFLENLEGTTYNVEDSTLIKTKFDSKNIFEEKINENWYVKKLTLPNVKIGSVIELKYTISSPFFFNMRQWKFQKKIPVIHSQLQYRAIPYYEYVFSVNGVKKLDKFYSKVLNTDIRHRNLLYKETLYNFELNNIPAFRDEEFISSSKDYMIAINFQLSNVFFATGGSKQIMSTWAELCNELIKHSEFGKYIKNSKKQANKILATLELDNLSEIDKIKTITEYVKYNYNWNGFYGKYSSTSASNFIERKTGNVADINLFLIGMLEAAGITVNPVILSTRNNGKINKDYPIYKSIQLCFGGSYNRW